MAQKNPTTDPRPDQGAMTFEIAARLGSLHKVIEAAASAGLATHEELAQAVSAANRYELLERSRTALAPEELAAIEERLLTLDPAELRDLEDLAAPEEGPQDESELTDWLTRVIDATPWATRTLNVPLGDYGAHQHLLRIETKDAGTLRLGINHGWDEELEEDFDSAFPSAEPAHSGE